jgi:hypothetical protein
MAYFSNYTNILRLLCIYLNLLILKKILDYVITDNHRYYFTIRKSPTYEIIKKLNRKRRLSE